MSIYTNDVLHQCDRINIGATLFLSIVLVVVDNISELNVLIPSRIIIYVLILETQQPVIHCVIIDRHRSVSRR